jgi:hypothetical protein
MTAIIISDTYSALQNYTKKGLSVTESPFKENDCDKPEDRPRLIPNQVCRNREVGGDA